MATPLTGLNGAVQIEGVAIASLRSWSLTHDMDPQEVGGFGSRFERQAPGRHSIEGSCEGVWAYGDAAGQGALELAARNDTLVTLTLGTDASHLYVGEAYITSLEVGAEYDGVTTFN